ncbi:MAG: pyridoxamine 5'-phosphate oxidase family protein [Bacteroidales bacterium]|jgi:uncharacterized pyridoxamine 5'-phosphate oxidase family protein|nr:pyridoxamine 5'-phosphate oxidase family protein [Bacteroidales bacterium]
MNEINEIIEFLGKSAAYFLATVDENNQPQVRPFSFVMEWNGKLTFTTAKPKLVYKQLQKNPIVAISLFDGSSGKWIRISGNIKFTDEEGARKKVFELAPNLLDLYPQGHENPDLACFYIEKGEAQIYSFAKHTPEKVIKF